mgnify:CR=1 FL=1
MFVILVYDVNKKRVSKVMKTCRKYLTRVQNSVFEGNITEKRLSLLKNDIKKIIVPEQDTVSVYTLESIRYVRKDGIGMVPDTTNII